MQAHGVPWQWVHMMQNLEDSRDRTVKKWDMKWRLCERRVTLEGGDGKEEKGARNEVLWVPALQWESASKTLEIQHGQEKRYDEDPKTGPTRVGRHTSDTEEARMRWCDSKWTLPLYGQMGLDVLPFNANSDFDHFSLAAAKTVFKSVEDVIEKCGAKPQDIAVIAADGGNWRLVHYLVTAHNVNVKVHREPRESLEDDNVKTRGRAWEWPLATIVTKSLQKFRSFQAADDQMFTQLIERGAFVPRKRHRFLDFDLKMHEADKSHFEAKLRSFASWCMKALHSKMTTVSRPWMKVTATA